MGFLQRRSRKRPLSFRRQRGDLEAPGRKRIAGGILGRIGVSVSGADANRVYAIIEAKDGGIYRSEDAGENWTRVNDDGRFRQRAWYFSKIYADPKSPDTVYVLNTGVFKSVDGGKTFNSFPPVTAITMVFGLIHKIRIESQT